MKRFISPVYQVISVPLSKIDFSAFQDDQVSSDDLEFLYQSVLEDGFLTPIVCDYDADKDSYRVIDGISRCLLMKHYKDIYNRERGMIPSVLLSKQSKQAMQSRSELVSDLKLLSVGFSSKPTFFNLTPHTVRVVAQDGSVLMEVPAEAHGARVSTEQLPIGEIAPGIWLMGIQYGDTQGLPDPQPDTYYIVSMVVAQANPHRGDLIYPNTGPGGCLRDAHGQIVGTYNFVSYAAI
jgi:hypothetical protein